MPSNDNDLAAQGITPPLPDPHGQAALLLVESLIHGLLARSIITLGDAIDIVETADSVQVEVAEAADGAGAPMWRSHALLTAMISSLKSDSDDDTAPLQPVP
ncbi:hypothetical protein [Sphingomonas bacterium]|uniref:hypothetical protein n=1 Tax=Sphingomonas bacterium TaxID=1895847 RepID=UPI00157513AA|nr:hypothetical protein [Sphingomonas bacterium]